MSDNTKPPLKTIEDIKRALEVVLMANDYKPGSKIAKTCEFSFLQGMLFAENSYVSKIPIIPICMMSGRSILTL